MRAPAEREVRGKKLDGLGARRVEAGREKRVKERANTMMKRCECALGGEDKGEVY